MPASLSWESEDGQALPTPEGWSVVPVPMSEHWLLRTVRRLQRGLAEASPTMRAEFEQNPPRVTLFRCELPPTDCGHPSQLPKDWSFLGPREFLVLAVATGALTACTGRYSGDALIAVVSLLFAQLHALDRCADALGYAEAELHDASIVPMQLGAEHQAAVAEYATRLAAMDAKAGGEG